LCRTLWPSGALYPTEKGTSVSVAVGFDLRIPVPEIEKYHRSLKATALNPYFNPSVKFPVVQDIALLQMPIKNNKTQQF
jgi:hypothetical protein